MPELLQREQHGQLDDVDPERLVGEAELLELALDLARELLGDARIGRERAAQRRDARACAALEPRTPGALVRRVGVGIHLGGRDVEPRVVQRVVPGGRAEVPRDRVGIAG